MHGRSPIFGRCTWAAPPKSTPMMTLQETAAVLWDETEMGMARAAKEESRRKGGDSFGSGIVKSKDRAKRVTKKARHSIETRSTLRKVYEDGESQTIIRQQPVVNVHLVCK